MKKSTMCAAVLLIAVSAHAQGKPRKFDASLMANLNAIDTGVKKVMETEGSRINFSRWDAPIELIDSSKREYEVQKSIAEYLHESISKMRTEGVASSPQLFFIYSQFRDVMDTLISLENYANERQRDPGLSEDLIKIYTGLIHQESKLNDALVKSMLRDSNDLEKCDGKTY